MLIPCTTINTRLKEILKIEVGDLKLKGIVPRLLAIIIGDSPEQQSYIRIKMRIAEELGIEFVLWELDEVPSQSIFAEMLKLKIKDVAPHGVLIQQPLPPGYDSVKIHLDIPIYMDIEGHVNRRYAFPLVLSCILGLTWVYYRQTSIHEHIHFEFVKLPVALTAKTVDWLRTRSIVIAGRGLTSGSPIATYFTNLGIPYKQTHSRTAHNDEVYRAADIIISGVGKEILTPANIRPGVVLLNFGLHEKMVDGRKKLKGDYDEEKIKDIAALYSGTPGGLGPIDVTCMYANLIQAAQQTNHLV
ncbi:MAG: tetrahydrofolate dehydrogenase/cyclohydrolase catalytic domain-containing protein [Candidatus Roizmanbacteria bacterium]